MYLLDRAYGPRILLVLGLATAALWLRPAEAPKGRVIVTETSTTILDVVEFAPGTAELRAHSHATLDAVAETLQGNPSIQLVEVQAHTRGDGGAEANLDLSQHRADAVMAYIVAKGVEPMRLTAQGYGDTQPLAPGVAAKNERVAFLILKRN